MVMRKKTPSKYVASFLGSVAQWAGCPLKQDNLNGAVSSADSQDNHSYLVKMFMLGRHNSNRIKEPRLIFTDYFSIC